MWAKINEKIINLNLVAHINLSYCGEFPFQEDPGVAIYFSSPEGNKDSCKPYRLEWWGKDAVLAREVLNKWMRVTTVITKSPG